MKNIFIDIGIIENTNPQFVKDCYSKLTVLCIILLHSTCSFGSTTMFCCMEILLDYWSNRSWTCAKAVLMEKTQ